MLREYAITLHFTMDDYDASQDMHRLTEYLRRIVDSYADEDTPATATIETGAEVE